MSQLAEDTFVTHFGVPHNRIGRSAAGRRIHEAGLAYCARHEAETAAEAEEQRKRSAEDAMRRLAEEARRQRAEQERQFEERLKLITERVQTALDQAERPSIGVDDVLVVSAYHFKVGRKALRGPSRAAALVLARHVAIYLALELTGASTVSVARLFGGRDHTSIIHARRRIAAMVAADDPVIADIEAIRARLFA